MLRKDEPAVKEVEVAHESPATSTTSKEAAEHGRVGFWKPAIALVLAAGVGVFAYENGLDERVEMKNLSRVEQGLWRSGQFSQFMVGPSLNYVDPDLIVSLSVDNPENPDNMAEYAAARAAGIERVHVSLKGDGTGDPDEYVEAIVYAIEARRADRTVLVHCSAGSERTGGFVALWRTLVNGESVNEGIAQELRRHGHDLEEGVLVDYLNDNVAFIADGLVERGYLAERPDPLPHFRTE